MQTVCVRIGLVLSNDMYSKLLDELTKCTPLICGIHHQRITSNLLFEFLDFTALTIHHSITIYQIAINRIKPSFEIF